MISGMFDLSIGGILAFSGIMAGLAAKQLGFPPIPAFLVGCIWGMVLGVINGVLVTRFRINALIATLATHVDLSRRAATGFRLRRNQYRQWLHGLRPDQDPGHLFAVLVHGGHRHCCLAFWSAAHDIFRQAYYIGGNPRAAKLSGINVDRTVFIFFVIMGLLSGLAGALLASRLNTAVVLAGQGVELKVITAVVLGGASLLGGVGTIFGAFLGVLFMSLLQNAMIVGGDQSFLAAHRCRLRAARQRRTGPVR